MDEQKRLALASDRIDQLAGMVQSLRAECARLEASNAAFQRNADEWRERALAAEAERDALKEAAKTLQRVQFIFGGHNRDLADCAEVSLRFNAQRAMELMSEKLPPIVAALEPSS